MGVCHFAKEGQALQRPVFELDHASSQPLKQLCDLNPQSLGNLLNALQSEVPPAAFHLSDICPMQIAGFSHLLLRPLAS